MGSYSNYLATVTFRPYLQPMPGLGSGARITQSVIVGGPRAGAGSSARVYDYLRTTGQLDKILYSPKMNALREKYQLWWASANGNNYGLRYAL
jgi:hypothetical protein